MNGASAGHVEVYVLWSRLSYDCQYFIRSTGMDQIDCWFARSEADALKITMRVSSGE